MIELEIEKVINDMLPINTNKNSETEDYNFKPKSKCLKI